MDIDQIAAVLNATLQQYQNPISSCLEKHDLDEFWIEDPPGKIKPDVTIHAALPNSPTEDRLFKVENPNRIEIGVLKYDGCFVPNGHVDKRADAILIAPDTICFLELKFDATSIAREAKLTSEGAKQLRISIERFRGDFANKKQPWPFLVNEAYIALPAKFPKMNTGIKALRKAFLDDLKFRLFESNVKTFP